MKRLTITILGLILLVGLVVAGGTSFYNRDIDIDNKKLDIIKDKTSKERIEITTSDIICDDSICTATIFQEDVIDMKWTNSKEYCVGYENWECVRHKDYTKLELEKLLDITIKDVLENMADEYILRDGSGIKTKVSDGGIATIR